jgi:Fe2+ or Zn2+ uptake regulation protein
LDAEDQFTDIGKRHGYQVTDHWLQLNGLCLECQKKEQN